MDYSRIMFKKSDLGKCALITQAHSKVKLIVARNVSERNLILATEAGKNDKYIVTLRAIPIDKATKVKALFANREEVPITEMKDVFLTASIWVNDPANPPQLPIKGEEVFVNIGPVPNRDGEEVLRVTAMVLQPARVITPPASWDAVFDSLPPVDEDGNVIGEETVTNQHDVVHQ
jgi:hypothetical protein